MSTEKKDIREYLHYYIGCECWVQGQIEENPIKLTGISWDDQTGEWWCYFENTETAYALIEDVAPLLYRLEDMQEKDCINIYTIERDKLLHPPTDDHDIRRGDSCWKIVRLDLIDTTLFITDEGIIYKVTEDAGKPMIEFIRNLPHIFHYLLSKGYWLFGNDWFDEGYIIDKKTLNNG